jgi:hypothetical protein
MMDARTHRNAAYWRAHCSPGDSVDATDYVIRIVMGEVTDYFKPKGGRDLCTVLSAYSTAGYTTWSASPHGPFVRSTPRISPSLDCFASKCGSSDLI